MRLEALFADERAIEGLPVRLVVAFVVGVASLSVMLSMVSGLGGLATSELGAQLGQGDEVISPNEQSLEVTVVDTEGRPVPGATVLVKPDTADLDEGMTYTKTGDGGTATLTVDPDLARGQSEGRLQIDIKPPSAGDYRDRQDNTQVLVVRN
jgi:hypothetical protein